MLNELSVFVDESGDAGPFDPQRPFYIVTFVFHEQKNDISQKIADFERHLTENDFQGVCLHTNPLFHGKGPFIQTDEKKRHLLLVQTTAFFNELPVFWHSFIFEKKQISSPQELAKEFDTKLSRFIQYHYSYFLSFDLVKIYYDNGQTTVTQGLSSALLSCLNHLEFRKVFPSNYRLFQMADFLCTMTLLNLKIERNPLTKTEQAFFKNKRDFKRNYWRFLERKEMK
jgi:hypothetical protein